MYETFCYSFDAIMGKHFWILLKTYSICVNVYNLIGNKEMFVILFCQGYVSGCGYLPLQS